MLFNSVGFLLVFLPAFLILYKLTPDRLKNITLLAGSFIFYIVGERKYLLFFAVLMILNCLVGLRLDPVAQEKRSAEEEKLIRLEIWRKVFLVAAVTGDALILFLFKVYSGENGVPLGLSFFIFTMIGYLADVYRGEERSETSLICFASYAMMFPKMTSGPITEYGRVRERLHRRKVTWGTIKTGLQIFTMGLAAKVLLADRLGILWHDVQVIGFESISTPLAWMAAIAYSCKLYFDFYGYSLMAVGLGKMLGFSLPANFKNPYMSTSVREFYRRWHVTLGQWLKKYVYIPLGGSRRSELETVRNLIIVWGITSIWHGLSLNFLIWGMSLCLLIILERIWCAAGLDRPFRWGFLRILPHLYVWFVIPITWMCFAIADIPSLQIYLGRMLGVIPGIQVSSGDWIRKLQDYWYLFLIALPGCTRLYQRLFRRLRDTWIGLFLLALLYWVCVWKIQTDGQNPFLYFKF